MTLVYGRTNLARDVINSIRNQYGMAVKIYNAQIPMAVKAAEASKRGKSIYEYDPSGRPAEAYMALTKEVLCAWCNWVRKIDFSWNCRVSWVGS